MKAIQRFLAIALSLVLALSLCVVPGFAASDTYSDTHGHWAEASIERWSDYDIVSGYGGSFKPDDNMTRGQLAKVLANTLGLTEEPKIIPFSDVNASDWFAPYVMRCYAAGIMLGSNGKANPNDSITREQAIVMMCRAMNIEPDYSGALSVFPDGNAAASYAAPYIAAMVKAGVIGGDQAGRVQPQGNLTRGALMAILDRSVVQYINEPGTYDLTNKDGVILVASGNVTLTGTTSADLVITPAADGKAVSFEKATVKGAITVQADNATIKADKDSKLPEAEMLGTGSKIDSDATTETTKPSTGGSSGGGGGSSSGGSSGGGGGSSSGGGTVTPSHTSASITASAPAAIANKVGEEIVVTLTIKGNDDAGKKVYLSLEPNVPEYVESTKYAVGDAESWTPFTWSDKLGPEGGITLPSGSDTVTVKLQFVFSHPYSHHFIAGLETADESADFLTTKDIFVEVSETELTVTEAGSTYSNRKYDAVTIAESVGNGDVTFNNVEFSGDIVVQGGGSNSIKMIGCDLTTYKVNIVLDKEPGDGKETPRLELTGTAAPSIEVSKPAIIEAKDSTSTIAAATVSANVEVRGTATTIAQMDIPADIEEVVTVTATAGNIAAITAASPATIGGTAGTVDVVTASAPVNIHSETVSSVVITEDAPEDVAVNISGDSAIEVVVNTTTGVAIETTGENVQVEVSTDLDETPSGITVGGEEVTHIHKWAKKSETAPTCTEAGSITYECKVEGCELNTKVEAVAALGHDLVVIEAVAPTCTTKGCTAGEYCQREGCDYIKQGEEIPATGHKAGEEWEHDADNHFHVCTVCDAKMDEEAHNIGTKVDGCVTTKTCATCGYTEVEGEHTVVVDEAKKPTCTEVGKTEGSHCSVCKKVLKEQEDIEALGHKYREAYEFDESGHWKICTVCEEPTNVDKHVFPETTSCAESSTCTTCGYVAAAGEHRWDAGEETKAPTCTEAGVWTYTCSSCGEEKTEPISALGHKFSTEYTVDKAATCTEDGYKSYHCTHKGCEETEGSAIIFATGHTPETITGKPATCTETGLTDGSRCSVCQAILKEQEIIPFAHTPVTDEAVAATCSKTGLTEGSHCSVCDAVIKVQEVIPMLDHDWSGEYRSSELGHYYVCLNCGENGEIAAHAYPAEKNCGAEAQCTECGYTKPAETHMWNAGEQTKAPTCTEAGTWTYRCSSCAFEKVVDLPALGHTEVIDVAVEATCTEKGKTQGSHCSVCGTVLKAQDEIPATGHTEVIDEAVDPTCTVDGKTEGKHCSVCNAVIVAQETIPAAHVPSPVAGKPATCTEAGLTEGSKCDVCDEVLKAQEEIPATGHTEQSVEAVEATCTKPGCTMGKKCSVCGAILEGCESVEMLPHVEEQVLPKEATCTEAGNTAGVKCSVCGTIISGCEEIPAAGHTEVIDEVAVNATCTEAGKAAKSHCSVCEKTMSNGEEVPALGHDYESELTVDKEATCTEAGSKSYHCTRCASTTGVTEIPAAGHAYVYAEIAENDDEHSWSCSNCEATGTEAHSYGSGDGDKTCTDCGHTQSVA